jgi:DNA-binding CsgD family transcriptional regulator/tetratricopeptide (TPR) repeat protein
MELLERESALATLHAAYEAAAHGHGRVVVVAGEPGIGKTALVDHFVRSLDGGARVLVGACDDLSIPRPLGPLRDLVGDVSTALAGAIERDEPPHEVVRLLIDELAAAAPSVLVLEDVHWADHATIDVATVLARRLVALPVVLVLTFRTGEMPPGHPLEAALGRIQRGDASFVELEPLSPAAVAQVAGDRAAAVFEATRGNPFFVAELVECSDSPIVPRSVASAVLGRVATMSDETRRLLELLSVVPGRVPTAVLDTAAPDWLAAAEEPERRHLLKLKADHVRFRHDLARRAVEAGLPDARKRRLHGRILDALLETRGDPADIVHHAEAAGADGVVGEYALVAARRAAAVDSNREAYAHYHRALDFLELLPLDEQGRMLEELARTAYYVGRLTDALAAIEQAIPIYEHLDDRVGLGRSLRCLSRLTWFVGDGPRAREIARRAVAILEPLGESAELGRAYAGLSQLAMLEEDVAGAEAWGSLALAIAGRFGDERTRANALVNIGTAKSQTDPDAVEPLLEAHAVADRAGDAEEATRALGNLAFTALLWGRPAVALEYAQRAFDYARGHEVHSLAAYNATSVAWLRLRAGEWDEAEATAARLIREGDTIPELLARMVLTELAVRRGDADAGERLADLRRDAERTGEIHRIAPAVELAVEHALLTGAPMPEECLTVLVDRAPAGNDEMHLRAWAAVAGVDVEPGAVATPPYAAMQRRDWGAAAGAFGEIGWMYERALMLSLLDDREALAESLEIARGLGAAPLFERVTGRLRDLGLRIPRGPRRTTRDNPAHLTERQLEVLTLLADGRTNAEIADALVVSLRTAEHHVAAVLQKLGARDRRQAARHAAALGI